MIRGVNLQRATDLFSSLTKKKLDLDRVKEIDFGNDIHINSLYLSQPIVPGEGRTKELREIAVRLLEEDIAKLEQKLKELGVEVNLGASV